MFGLAETSAMQASDLAGDHVCELAHGDAPRLRQRVRVDIGRGAHLLVAQQVRDLLHPYPCSYIAPEQRITVQAATGVDVYVWAAEAGSAIVYDEALSA